MAMTNPISINDKLADDPLSQVSADWSERKFPNDLKPGTAYVGTFHLQTGEAPEHEPFEEVGMGPDKTQTLVVHYKTTVTLPKNNGDGTFDKTVGFQRVNFYQSPAMRDKAMNPSGVDLLKALGLRVEPLTTEAVKAAFQQADIQGTPFTFTVDWEVFDKATSTRYTTKRRPNQAKGEVAWPRNDKGGYEDFLVIDGEKKRGNTVISGFRTKKA